MELLVESLDNANDLKPLGLWPQIVKHFTSSEPEVVVQALWVCGTAVQVRGKLHLSVNSDDSFEDRTTQSHKKKYAMLSFLL